MIAIGLVLLLGVAGYYAYAHYARTGFEDLSFEVEPITVNDVPAQTIPIIQAASNGDPALEVDASQGSANLTTNPSFTTVATPLAVSTVSSEILDSADQSPEPTSSIGETAEDAAQQTPDSVEEAADGAAQAIPNRGLFQIESFAMSHADADIHPKYWGDPLWAGTDRLERYLLPEGYVPATYTVTNDAQRENAQASRMVISDIDVDAIVANLRIIDLGDSQAYETPKNIVGHIPGTANPGEYHNGWYFGHLQSPIRGEGNVFRLLPSLSKLIRDGDPIFVELYSADGQFLYQVVSGAVVHPTQLELTRSTEAEITLVTCYPPLVYDHRYVVTAKLVGVRN